jgi:hypothetical protein
VVLGSGLRYDMCKPIERSVKPPHERTSEERGKKCKILYMKSGVESHERCSVWDGQIKRQKVTFP